MVQITEILRQQRLQGIGKGFFYIELHKPLVSDVVMWLFLSLQGLTHFEQFLILVLDEMGSHPSCLCLSRFLMHCLTDSISQWFLFLHWRLLSSFMFVIGKLSHFPSLLCSESFEIVKWVIMFFDSYCLLLLDLIKHSAFKFCMCKF